MYSLYTFRPKINLDSSFYFLVLRLGEFLSPCLTCNLMFNQILLLKGKLSRVSYPGGGGVGDGGLPHKSD